MRRISLLSVEMMAFKSFRDPQKVKLSTGPGFKSLTGDNEAEPKLGANGAGKSSFLDAIFWCCYGTGLKGQKASALQTWHCDIRPVVVTRWRIAKEIIEIKRIGSPDKLEINGQPASQEDVDRMLGLTKMRFRHAVIFGQNVAFFAQLSIADRSALMEEVCDLSLWQRAADKAEAEAKACKAEVDDHEREILRFETRLESLPKLKALRLEQSEWHENHSIRLEEAQAEHGAAAAELRAMPQVGEGVDEGPTEKAALVARKARDVHTEAVAAWQEAARKRKELHSEWKHLEENPNCIKCGQRWPNREKRSKELLADIKKLAPGLIELAHARDDAERLLTAAEEKSEAAAEAFHGAEKEAARNVGARVAQEKLVRSLKARLDEIKAETDEAIAERIADTKTKRAHYLAQIEDRKAAQQKAEGRMGVATYWKSAFKQVRLFQMKRVLQHLELEIEAAMNSLGLHGWKIALATETETKSGTFKQGVQIQVTSPKASAPWESWSGGESQRLTLAITTGFANMIQRMSGVSYSFEFWDEPSAWLSAEGIEDMINTLRERAAQERISLWLVDHRSQGAAFDETWVITKNEESSYVAQV